MAVTYPFTLRKRPFTPNGLKIVTFVQFLRMKLSNFAYNTEVHNNNNVRKYG